MDTPFFFRYRSISSLKQYNELQNLDIYFASPQELNDPLERDLNVVWKGDEIAFRGLFKHYLYVLSHLYYEAKFRNPAQKIDIEHLPVFVTEGVLQAPEMAEMFRDIYNEFFDSKIINMFPSRMADSGKKFTADEIVCLFRAIHLYAYMVVNNNIQKHLKNRDLLQEKEYHDTYQLVKNWREYSRIINYLVNLSEPQDVISLINSLISQQEQNKNYTNKMFADKDTFNISILSFDFPELYVRQIKKLIYANWYIACFSTSFRNEPMWSHYADQENGICLCFKVNTKNKENFLPLSGRGGDDETMREYKLAPVKYLDLHPEINFFTSLGGLPFSVIKKFMLCDYDSTRFSSCLKAYEDTNWRITYADKFQETVCTKNKNWSYEKEYRLFYLDVLGRMSAAPLKRVGHYNLDSLEGIIFGRRVVPEDKRHIIEIVREHCKRRNRSQFYFFDLYYSTITNRLECRESVLSGIRDIAG